jgi:hypothetical protein
MAEIQPNADSVHGLAKEPPGFLFDLEREASAITLSFFA